MNALIEAEDDRDLFYPVKVTVVPLAPFPSEAMQYAQKRALYSKNANELLDLARKKFLADSNSDMDCLIYYLGDNENSDEETMDIVAFHHYESFTFGISVPEKVLKSNNSSKKAIQKVANFTLKGDADYEQDQVKYHDANDYVDMMIMLCQHRHITTNSLDNFTDWALGGEISDKKYQLLQAITLSEKVDGNVLTKITNFVVSNYRKNNTHIQESSTVTFEEALLIHILDNSKVTKEIISTIYDMKADNLHWWYMILDRIAGNILTPATIFHELAKCNYPEVKRTLAENSSIDGATREILGNDPDEQVREIIAEDTKTSVNTLKKLASDKNRNVRYRVAGNTSCTEEVFEILVNEKEDPEILAEVYENSTASRTARKKILDIWGIE